MKQKTMNGKAITWRKKRKYVDRASPVTSIEQKTVEENSTDEMRRPRIRETTDKR